MYKDGKLITMARRPNPLNSKMVMELIYDLDAGDGLEEFIESSKEDLICYHHSFGRHIRNTYMHGTDFMDAYPDEHFDDVSFEIIQELYEILLSLRLDTDDLSIYGRDREVK